MRLVNLIQFPPEMDQNWVRYGLAKLDKFLDYQTGRGCCFVRTQNSFSTQQVRHVGITRIVTLFGLNLCAETPDR